MLVAHVPLYIVGSLLRKYIAGSFVHKVASALGATCKLVGRGKGLGGGGRKVTKKTDATNRLADAALTAGETTADALAKRPGVQASLDSLKMRLTTGSPEKHEIIDEVYGSADEIVALLNSKGVHAKRLAIDGVPGSGKSTLARALAEKLGFSVETLDYTDLDTPRDFSAAQTIYEHHRLLRTQNIDDFDAIIYIDEPAEISQGKCVHRKRGGINIDVLDYEKLKRIGEEAFNSAAGRAYTIGSHIKVKIRPTVGFGDYKNIRDKAESKGIKTNGLSKEELLFAAVYGRPRKGLKAYVKLGAYNKEILEGLSAGVSRLLMP